MVHEDVLKMCKDRRQLIWNELTRDHPDWSQEVVQFEVDRQQPLFEDYDPVVMMAVMSANYAHPVEVRLRAGAEAAQYLRPKLKSIEMTVDPSSATERARRDELASRLVGLLDAASAAKRETTIDAEARDVTPPPAPPPDEPTPT